MRTHEPGEHDRVNELLAAYAAGSTSHAERSLVVAHLRACPACREELAGWRAIRSGMRAAAPAVREPGPEMVATVLARAGAGLAPYPVARPRPRAALRHAVALLVAQVPLVRRRLWLASALVMTLGAGIAAAGTREAAGLVLALVAPVVAAAGLAVVYGPEVDPGLELAVATPTSPRSVLLARLTLVFGYDLALAVAASVFLVWFGAAGSMWILIGDWFGPMALLSALSLAASVWLGPGVALSVAMVVWVGRLLASRTTMLMPGTAERLAAQVWSTNAFTLGLAFVLVFAALVLAPRRALFATA